MKRTLTLLLLVLAAMAARAARHTFAVVVDTVSLRLAAAELRDYARAVEQTHGWRVVTLPDRWGCPDSLRAALRRLYLDAEAPLTGAVFVGDIPIPMVRDAQHLTSAFKMDQRAPRHESSVPSDRFYDDFDLLFEPLGRDEGTPLFYYSLTAASPQELRPDIFSGRIRPTDAGGTSRYEKLRRYLRKAVAAKRGAGPVRRLFYFTGHGSLSESAVAHIDEKRGWLDHFPALAALPSSVEYMNFADAPDIKTRLMNQLMRTDIDIAVLHHHGDWDTQYLSDSVNLTLADFDALGFAPSCRLVVLDACFNGSFHRDDCIASRYVFSEGETVVALGGTVNLLQDKRYDRYMGLLDEGVCVGRIHQYTCRLEEHVIGDPTFAFAPRGAAPLPAAIHDGEAAGRRLLSCPLPDARCLALACAFRRGEVEPGRLVGLVRTDPSPLVRLEALMLLAESGGEPYVEALAVAAADNYEMTQRFAANGIGRVGHPSLALPLVRLLASPGTSARVRFCAEQSLQYFPADTLRAALHRLYADPALRRVDKAAEMQRLETLVVRAATRWTDDVARLCSGAMTPRQARQQADYLRIYLPHAQMADVARLALRCNDAELARALVHALGWHGASWRAAEVRELLRPLATDPAAPPAVRDEARRTLKRLTPGGGARP